MSYQSYGTRIYKTIAPSLTARDYKEPRMVLEMMEVKIIGQMDNTIDHTFESANRVYDKEGLCPTLSTCAGGGLQPKVIMEKGKINKVGQISNDGSQCGTVVSEEGLFPTISAGTHGYANAHIATHYRIRKLTPKECWRLMGYTDEDFEKASKVNSNTQLYKQAGNAIVKQVLMAIFSQLNIKGVKAWNDMTETEKRDIIKKTTMAGE